MRIAEGPQPPRSQPPICALASPTTRANHRPAPSPPTEHAFVKFVGATTAVSTANGFHPAVQSIVRPNSYRYPAAILKRESEL